VKVPGDDARAILPLSRRSRGEDLTACGAEPRNTKVGNVLIRRGGHEALDAQVEFMDNNGYP